MTDLSPQEEFDLKYITSTEIINDLQVARSSLLMAQRKGLFPEPIVIPGVKMSIWIREDIQENLAAWRIMLNKRRGNSVC
jgi:predicted DNA-binding transcriptional regulator AlpA